MVTAPASTGITAINRYAVMSHDHTNSGIRSSVIFGARMLRMVTMTLIAPRMEEIPIMWMAKIVIGKEAPIWIIRGGYIVQPPAGPPPGTNREDSSKRNANGKIQKLKLFNRGSAISGAPTCNGII